MDSYKAKQLEFFLKDKHFLNYKIIRLLNNGKSAAVFCGNDLNGTTVAIKIFDNELIERFGHDVQEKRIEQEIGLKGHMFPNLIKIIDGGKDQIEGNEYYYIIMEYIEGKNIKQYIDSTEYDHSFLQKVALSLFHTTESLLEKGIVHRDIKPENIMIDNNGNLILMDLGVLKLIGVPSFSDVDEKQFVGTLRYSPPEFLSRTEKDTLEGWKAVNLYQIGAVLHDLIMRKELFEEISPYSNLVIAIKEDAPLVTSDKYPFESIQLVRDLLTKEPNIRLSLVQNTRFTTWANKEDNDIEDLEKELEDIFKMTSLNKAKSAEIESINRSNNERKVIRSQISNKIEITINACFEKLLDKGLFSKYEKSQNFFFSSDTELRKKYEVKNILFKLTGDLKEGFINPLFLLVKFHNDEKSIALISLLGMYLSPFIKINLDNPLSIFAQISEEGKPINQSNSVFNRVSAMYNLSNVASINLSMYDVFSGTVGFDQQFDDKIALEFVKMIKKALKSVDEKVKKELETREKFARGEIRSFASFGTSKTTFFSNVE